MKFKKNHFHNMEKIREVKIRSNKRDYTIRDNRERYFFPDEWQVFYDNLSKKQQITFNSLINTGARINEMRNVLVSDIDMGRNTIILRMTKTRNKDGSRKIRVIPVSKQFTKYLRAVIKQNKLKDNDKLPILSTPAANIAMKKALKDIGIPDWKMFSIHNIRKTAETWLLSLDIDSLKVTKHFGHSIMIAQKHYVGTDAFSFEDKQMMRQVIGDLYER